MLRKVGTNIRWFRNHMVRSRQLLTGTNIQLKPLLCYCIAFNLMKPVYNSYYRTQYGIMERFQGVKMGKGLREKVLLGSNVLVVNGRMMKMRMMRMEDHR